METVIGKTKIEIVKNDILTMSADAIVNPANARLIAEPGDMAFGGLHLAIITQMGEKGKNELWLIKQGLHGLKEVDALKRQLQYHERLSRMLFELRADQ